MPIVFAHLAVRLHPAHEPLVIHEILHKRLRAALQRVARTGLECRRREVPITQANSAIWLHYGASLLGAGILTGLAAFRYASLAIIMLTISKVFLSDLSNLSGILRALSFIGLGLVLVGIGYFYQRFVFPQKTTQQKETG